MDLVDEYWLMTFLSIVGSGEKIFGLSDRLVYLKFVFVVQIGVALLVTYVWF